MISGEKTFPGTKIFNPNIATLMKRVIIAGIVLASLAACNTADPESTYLVDPSKEDPVADFDYTVESSSGKVLFTNKSTGSIAYRWIFGDASGSSSLEENPSFIYRQSGSYTVSLRASNGYTSNVKERSSNIPCRTMWCLSRPTGILTTGPMYRGARTSILSGL